jgi:hypothetical protein
VKVVAGAPGGGGGGGAGGGGGPVQDQAGNPNATAVKLLLGGTGTFTGRAASFAVTAPGPGRIAATVLAAGGAKASAAKATVLGKLTKKVSKAGKVKLKVTLKGRAARKLLRHRTVKVVLSTRFTPAGGTAGPAVKRTVKLKRH